MGEDEAVARLLELRQHQQGGHRSPHKPLLVLLSLAQLANTGTSRLPWSAVRDPLADLIGEFGPVSRTGRAQSAAYPFTRLRSDGVWRLDRDVPMDRVGSLNSTDVSGQLDSAIEEALRDDLQLLHATARRLVESNFPPTIAPDVFAASGFDPDLVLGVGPEVTATSSGTRARSAAWRTAVLQAWDRQCAFCGYDGQVGTATAALDAAHVRWFAFQGPDSLDNGLALCVLHHKLFDLGVLGLTRDLRVRVSESYTARTPAGRAVYTLHDKPLATARPDSALPNVRHVEWHGSEVFKGKTFAASRG